MAEYFAADGWTDITIAFPINLRQIDEINHLSNKITLGVLVENMEGLASLANSRSGKFNLWIKIDSGSHRTGVNWENFDQVIELTTEAQKHPNLQFKGILTHAGSTYNASSTKDAINQHLLSNERMIFLQRKIVEVGFPKPLISIGDTPGCSLTDLAQSMDEIRPGNFVFYDAEQLEIGSCEQEKIAVAMACPVVSTHPERDEIVIYGGSIHFSKESYLYNGLNIFGLVAVPGENGWGNIIPDCYIARLSQEHGVLHIPGHLQTHFPIGSLAFLIPAHSCLSAHLMRRYLTLDGQTINIMPI